MDKTKPVDHSDRATVKVRQGTGPRVMVTVLFTSLVIGAVAGVALLSYFFLPN